MHIKKNNNKLLTFQPVQLRMETSLLQSSALVRLSVETKTTRLNLLEKKKYFIFFFRGH